MTTKRREYIEAITDAINRVADKPALTAQDLGDVHAALMVVLVAFSTAAKAIEARK